MEVKYREDTQPKDQLKASLRSTATSVAFLHFQIRAPALVTPSVRCGQGTYFRCGRDSADTLAPLNELSLDIYKAAKLALELHAHCVLLV
eukprot:1154289-Pelagomonas_calceolata.AAC.1